MKDKYVSETQSVDELKELRKRVAELESLKTEHKKIEKEMKKLEVERSLLLDQLIKENEDLHALTQITANAISTLELNDLLNVLIERLVQVLRADTGAISLKVDDKLHYRASVGLEEVVKKNYTLSIGNGFSGIIAETMKPLYVEDAQIDPRITNPLMKQRGIRSMLGVPLKRNGNFIGVLHVDWLIIHPFNERELHLLEITAERCAMAILNSQLYENTKELKERLELQIDRMPIACILFDTDFLIRSWNPAAEKIFGFVEDEVLGKHAYDLIVPEEARKHVNGVWSSLLSGDMSAHSINENITRNGRKIICDWANTPIKKDDGTIVGVLSMARDITEQKYAEDALRESERHYRLLFENMLSGFAYCKMIFDNNNRPLDFLYLEVNDMFEKLTGLKDVIGKKVSEVIPGIQKTNPKLIEIYGRVAITGKPERFELDLKALGLWLLISVYSTDKGFFIAVFDNITDRKKAEETLATSEKKYRQLVELSQEGIWVIDEEARTTFVNPRMAEILGYEQGDMLGKSLFDFMNENGVKIAKENIERRKTGIKEQHDFEFIKKDGARIYTSLETSPIIDDLGKYRGALACVADITDRRKVEVELRQSYEKLDKTLTGFIKTMAKTIELKDPYTSGHQVRVANLVCAIAKNMGLKEDQIQGINVAATIHDIGKISVPSDILSKPGKLTKTEFNLIKSHPKIGYDILKSIEFPWPIAQIILRHHERMNGSGYPNHLKGEDICLEARILAVADVIEAMSFHRPYRPALGVEKAMEEISRNKGILYDPEVANTCINVLTKTGFKFE